MIDISNITITRCDNQIIPDISLCGKLEAFVGGYFLSNVLPESKVETLYYDATIDNIYDAVDTIEKNIVAYFVNDESIAFVKSEVLEKLKKETEEYGITYVEVNDFYQEVLFVDKGNIPDYLQEIIWIDDDFLSDDKLDFDYDAFELIDSKVSYLNPKHFSVYQMVCALKS